MAVNQPLHTDALREADRLMTICNACRYCEGLCAVFPAMEMRRTFAAGDLNYLANLCHQCGACYPDCQYAPPHQFEVNVPARARQIAQRELRGLRLAARLGRRVRAQRARDRARRGGQRRRLHRRLRRAGAIRSALFGANAGDFYRLMPHRAMVALFGAAALYALVALAMSMAAFWRDGNAQEPRIGPRIGPLAVLRALHDSFTLRYLGGGGGGCTSENEKPSAARRHAHHLTFYGFLLCFASTCVATLYHYVWHWPAPYPLLSLPVVLGTLGGLGLIAGPLGLFMLARRREAKLTDPAHRGMDTAFIAMLFLTGLTGLALLALRDTPAMGILLAVHLGLVLALFLTMPYGKFVHGLYRFLALVKYAAERRRGTFVE